MKFYIHSITKLSCILALLFTAGHVPAQVREGWISLFDGKTLNGWRTVGNVTFEVNNGAITGGQMVSKKNSFLVSEMEYSDFILEAEIKVEDPEGNSGIQLRSHYVPESNIPVYGRQMEIDQTERNWTGGIYDEARRKWLYPVSLNDAARKAYKPGEFNTFRIECIGNEMKTWVNDIPVAYLVDTLDKKGFIALQVHAVKDARQEGKKVWFKNIRIKTTDLKSQPFPKGIFQVNYTPNTLSPYEKLNGWKLLFNGTDNAGWKSAAGSNFPVTRWKVTNGILSVLPPAVNINKVNTSKVNTDIISKTSYKNFDLAFEFRLSKAAGSGLQYLVARTGSGTAKGLEYQLVDDNLHPDAKAGREGNRSLASLYDILPATKQARYLKNQGEWNNGRITVHPGGTVEHFLNGVKVLEYNRNDLPSTAMEGFILLQDQGEGVNFRSIKIKEL